MFGKKTNHIFSQTVLSNSGLPMVRSIKKSPLNKFQENGSSFWGVKKLCARTFGPPQFANSYVCLCWKWFRTDSTHRTSSWNHHHLGKNFFLSFNRLQQNRSLPIPETKCLFFFLHLWKIQKPLASIYVWYIFATLVPYKINQQS